jgi:hypothetical protein
MPDLKISQLPSKATPATSAVVPIVEGGSNYQATVQSIVTAGAPVLSVAGKTGTVTLAASDVSGLSASATTDTTNASNITKGTLSGSLVGTHDQNWSTILSTPTTIAGYGITDAVSSSDSRLTNARSPTAHKATHATGGTDALVAGDIGAAASSHSHGSITTDGKIGSTASQIVTTTTGGAVTAVATISTSQVSGLAASATTDTTSASNIGTGTLAYARMADPTVTSPAQITANQNDYSAFARGVNRFTTSASFDLTGMTAGNSGEVRVLVNVGTTNLVIKHQSTSSTTAANRFIVPWAGDCTITGSASVVCLYDATTQRWRLV